MVIIRKCGGRMDMAERKWAKAATDFFGTFKNYDEAGNQRRIQCLKNYIEDLLKNIRTQVLLKLIKRYTRIWIPFISNELNVPEKDVEQLLVSLILDNRIDGHIDQVNRLLERGDRSKGMKKYDEIDKWNSEIKSLYQTINNRAY